MPESVPQKPDKDSKSQRKEDMLAVQKIGESLLALRPEDLEKIELPEILLEAIQHAKTLTSHGAKRRQLQYIGKLMREVDPEPIKLALKRIKILREKSNAQFHLTESWRTKLLTEGDAALASFLNDYPDVERQQLRQLIRKAQQDRKNNKNTGAETALFKFLKALLGEA